MNPFLQLFDFSFGSNCRYSCFYSNLCSVWMSFGVYVLGILFQTAALGSFFLISHGYCVTCERLSLSERRTMATLGCVFYMTLVGYRASVPYFSVSLRFLVTVLISYAIENPLQNGSIRISTMDLLLWIRNHPPQNGSIQ